MRLKPYEIFSSDMFPVFTQAIAKMQCPFNNHIAFIDGGIRHWLALCHCKLTHERAHLFLLKSNDSHFCNVSTCARGFILASGLNFPRLRCTIAPCKLFELHLTVTNSEASSSGPLFCADSAEHFEDLKVCISMHQVCIQVTHKVRLFSLPQNERFAL